jgi:hypothetical protein
MANQNIGRRGFLGASTAGAIGAVVAGVPARVLAADVPEAAWLTRAGAVNVADFGAKLDSEADDSAAIQAAFDSLKRDGRARGTLIIPGIARIARPLDFDGGFQDATLEDNWNKSRGERLHILVLGSIRPDPGLGVAVRVHSARNLRADFHFDGGGADDDVALLVENLDQSELAVSADRFAGTVLKADATQDRRKRIRKSKVRHVMVTNCGQAIEWRGIEAFGPFQLVWDCNCRRGSHFFACADIGIGHYENYSPATQTIGLHFEECNMFNVGVITVGDRPTEALVQITGGDFGSIQRLRCTGRPNAPAGWENTTVGLRLMNVKSLSIDNLHTARCVAGLQAIGSSFTIKRHHSMTGDVVPMIIEGSDQYDAPRIDLRCLYRYTGRQGVRIDESIKGGHIRLSGQMTLINRSGGKDVFAVDCRSGDAVLDVSDLQIDAAPMAGSIHHASPEKLRGVSRATLGNPAVHGRIERADIAPGKIRQNGDRTLHVAIPVKLAPAAEAAAWAKLSIGASPDAMLPVAWREIAAGSGAQRDMLQATVPPFWSYRLDVAHAAAEPASVRLE